MLTECFFLVNARTGKFVFTISQPYDELLFLFCGRIRLIEGTNLLIRSLMKLIRIKFFHHGLLCGLLICVIATANGQTLLKDIMPGLKGSNPTSLINFNGTLFFLADDGVHGRELWKSDGTSAGTVLVKDVNPGSTGSDIKELVVVNNLLFFSAYSTAGNSNTRQLWRSDGTETGTFEPYDVHKDGEVQNPVNLTKVGNLLFYVTKSSLGGSDQWLLSKSDGTDSAPQKSGGTGSFFSISYSPLTDGNIPPSNFTDVNGTLFFTYGKTLWTTAGQPTDPTFKATQVKTFSSIKNLCAFKKKLYFSVGPALWVSEGTLATTKQLPGIGQTAITNIEKDILSLTPAGNYLYIVTGVNGRVLLASDGVTISKTPQATAPGFIRAITYLPAVKFPAMSSIVYFMADNNIYSLTIENWSLKKLPGTYQGVTNFVKVGSNLYFITSTGLSRLESSNGKVESVFSIPVSSSTFSLTLVSSRLYLSTLMPDPGQEVYYVNAALISNNPFGGN